MYSDGQQTQNCAQANPGITNPESLVKAVADSIQRGC
jgi:hypothetical protein